MRNFSCFVVWLSFKILVCVKPIVLIIKILKMTKRTQMILSMCNKRKRVMDRTEDKENNFLLKYEYVDKCQSVKEWLNKSGTQSVLHNYSAKKISIISDIIIKPAQNLEKDGKLNSYHGNISGETNEKCIKQNALEDPFLFESENESLDMFVSQNNEISSLINENFHKSDNDASEIIPIQTNIFVSSTELNRGMHNNAKVSDSLPGRTSDENVLSADFPDSISSVEDSLGDPSYIPSESENSEELNDSRNESIKSCGNNFLLEKMSCSKEATYLPHIGTGNVAVKPVEMVKKKNYADKLNYCFFCDKDVTHFVRHILTWHSTEITVQRILSLPPKSRERRNIIASLRKRGNYVVNRTSDSLRPVKRLKTGDVSNTDDFLPRSYCLGYYKRQSSYRHTKRCSDNTVRSDRRQTAQSDGQLILLAGDLLKHDQLLTEELFPGMRADRINFIAKKDMLICQYAYSYMKGRKSKGNIDFVRQNMRRLAKLLDFCQQKHPKIKNLIDVLKPSHFKLILDAVNYIARYNPETDVYESPTLAINFGTLLKKCCDLAYIQLIQLENTTDQRKDLKILKKLIESQWADEISAQAGPNLNESKWNKDELLPLTSDLKKLNTFLTNLADTAFNELHSDENNFAAYNTLKEVVYTQIILLNRRRPAEVAQLNIEKYNAINNLADRHAHTEFENCLTETEKILLNSYSRIVIRGKRGRGVPILLSPDMKKHFDYFISVRNNFMKDNKYVFHTNGQGCLDGTRTLYKYAMKCGIEKPKSINSTKLRKHLATITQLLQFSEKDLEQLSQFMGHTLKTHCKVYRLSDSLYQTAKVSKLLLLMAEEGIEQYKGEQLDEIDVDLNPILEKENILDRFFHDNTEEENEEHLNTVHKPEIKKKDKPARQPWTFKQKQIIADFFSDHIKHKRSPKQNEVEKLVELYPDEFQNRKWTSIKAVVFNMYTGKLNTYVYRRQ